MKRLSSRVAVCAIAGLVSLAILFAVPQTPSGSAQSKSAGGKKDGYDGPMNKVLLKDYDPSSNLVVPENHPPKAKFPVVDAHVHPTGSSPQDVARLVRAMDESNIEVAVLLTGAVGEDFDRMVDAYLKPHPSRFLLYCGMDVRGKDIESPDFPRNVAAELERCYRKGARGVGEVTDKGRGFGASSTVSGALPPREKRLFVDDPRLDLYWKKCAELKMAVNIHIADHPSAWQPPDERQERTPNFQQFNQYGHDVPTHAELIARFRKMIDRHPLTTFVAVHFANLGHDLAQLSKLLDAHKNLDVDLSARAYEFGRQPLTARAFFSKYKDRILYGSDQSVSVEMWRSWWRVMETRDEYIKGPAGWRLYGLGLPDDVLRAIYRDNARRLYNWSRPAL